MTPRRRPTHEKSNLQSLNTKSTGEILRRAREARGESLQEVSNAIQVRPSILQEIEAGRFFGLTDPLYLKGFIRSYARHVGLDEDEVIPFFRREYDEQQFQQQKLKAPLTPIETKRFHISPGRLVIGILTVAILAVVSFSYNQYVSVALTPPLELYSPAEEFVSDNGFVSIEGKTEPGAKLTLNGQSVGLSPDGSFSLSVALASGVNSLRLESVNSIGKVTTLERTVMGPTRLAQRNQENTTTTMPTPTVLAEAQEREASTATDSAALSQFDVEVEILQSPAWVEIISDGKSTFTGMMLPGASQSFSGGEQIMVKTGNAGSTKVYLNGVDQGVMGGDKEVVEKAYRK